MVRSVRSRSAQICEGAIRDDRSAKDLERVARLPNGSGVELRRPATRSPDGTTPSGRWPRSEATCYARTINRTRGEAFVCSNTVLGGAL
jgi:hypothetical protein